MRTLVCRLMACGWTLAVGSAFAGDIYVAPVGGPNWVKMGGDVLKFQSGDCGFHGRYRGA